MRVHAPGLFRALPYSIWSAPAMKVICEALTFDDVSLVPSYSEVLPKDVNLKTRLTTGLSLSVPLVSAAMDTVT
jgi:IMP dehydrogenase